MRAEARPEATDHDRRVQAEDAAPDGPARREDVWCLGSETGQEDTWPVTVVGSMVGYAVGVAAVGVAIGRTTDSMVAPMRVAVTGGSIGIS